MPENEGAQKAHVSISGFKESFQYVFPKTKREFRARRVSYPDHAAQLIAQLTQALGEVPVGDADTRLAMPGVRRGVLVEVETMAPTPQAMATKIPNTLDFQAQQIAVLKSERQADRTERAVMFVPDDARTFLRQRIEAYGSDNLGNHSRPDVEKFEVLEAIRQASPAALVVGDVDFAAAEAGWWELWIRRLVGVADAVAGAAANAGLDVHPDRLTFPDTEVLFVNAAPSALLSFVGRLNGAISEIRPAAPSVEPLLDLGDTAFGQHELVDSYLARVTPPGPGAPVICVIDAGIAGAHPLVAPALAGAWAADEDWGSDDNERDGGHGTAMAGLILHGDLTGPLQDDRLVELGHAVESVKFLPPEGFPATEPTRYGLVTQNAVSIAEIEGGNAVRSFCLATSSPDFVSEAPSSWSGALDQIASGSMPGDRQDNLAAKDHPKRLLVVATGNMQGGQRTIVEQHHSLEDPAQSWNALTIGGYTAKVDLSTEDPHLMPLAGANKKSPFSCGSQLLPPDLTPIKPEVLFEAGNMMVDSTDFCGWHRAVSLISTGRDVINEPLIPFWATSAATGMAGNFLGRLKAAVPGLWPETYRALMIQSADWPHPLRKLLIGKGRSWKTMTKGAKQKVLREVGFGVPNFARASSSMRNDLTLIAEAEIQPYTLTPDGRAVFNEVHFYDLPWPSHALQALENSPVIMKATLSYFIEPNLSGRAGTRPDTYRSFGLRFALKKRNDTANDFRRRLSKSDEKAEKAGKEDDRWLLGPQAMVAGSLHCDLWRGPAVELAGHDEIAVFPVGGWWKSHLGQHRANDKARYSLLLSISAPDLDVDLYAEVEAAIATRVPIAVPVGPAG
ncbi:MULTISPECIES: S8 family peptidase [Sphingomonas]|uniref:S8 family peptidase n=1 Tax=Sphingomonas TaxID=13687 RepID=UPI000DF01C45|nr:MULTISPECIES: S8 family peptidase [Sphingomonas]